jgi:hypothetical protein
MRDWLSGVGSDPGDFLSRLGHTCPVGPLRALVLAIGLAGIMAGCGAATGSMQPPTVPHSSASTTGAVRSPAHPVGVPKNVILEADGLGIVTVGEGQLRAVQAMTEAIGAPTATGGSGCLDRTEVHWGDLSLEFRSGRLDGYRYLNGPQTLMGLKVPTPAPNTPLLRTQTGATIGMTLAQVRALYPPSDFSLAHDGSISVSGVSDTWMLLSFFGTAPSTPLWEIKGGAACGDF